MANKRMFSMFVIDSDAFLDMPLSAQAVYFHMSMRADDDGFINNPKKILRMICGSEDDLKLLIAKKFIIPFETGVMVIRHWRIHNIIRKDMYKPTQCEEKALIEQGADNSYRLRTEPVTNTARTRYEHGALGIGLDIDKDLDKDKGIVIDTVCSEPQDGTEQADTPVIPLNNGEGWRPTVSDYDEWCTVYPNVDVYRELERMRQWCLSNPSKRKTKKGIRRFVTNWLDGEQNKPRRANSKRSTLDDIDKWAENMRRAENAEQNILG